MFLAAGACAFGHTPTELDRLDDTRVEASTLPLDAGGRTTGAIGRNIFEDKDQVALDLVERRHGLPIACYGDSIVSDTPMAMLVDLVNRTLDPAGDGT